jgi:hypothetical protein
MNENQFEIGQSFSGKYPPEAAMWCNANGATMEYDSETGIYTIAAIPPPTVEELQKFKLNELSDALARTDWMAIRENDRKFMDPNYVVNISPFEYRNYLREFNHQEGEWWAKAIPTFEQFREGSNETST